MARFYFRPGHPKASPNGFVSAEDLGAYETPKACNAPIMMDRFYENTAATDGTDIGSRRKHREYMRANNLTTVDDYKGEFAKAQRERDAAKEGRIDSKTRREALERRFNQLQKP